jgi:predicted dehydrogenase
MSVREMLSRRKFLGGGAAALGAALAFPEIVPAAVLPGPARKAPGDRLTLGCIGVGSRGSDHLNGFLGNRRVKILAVCDVDQTRRMEAKKKVDATNKDEGCTAYNDFRDLLDRKDIDLVVIAIPDHWHALVAIYACKAGKDIYCEKPLTLTIEEGRALVSAVRRYGRVFQVGSQQRSESNFRFACELAQSGRIGKVHTIRTGFGASPSMGWEPEESPPPGLDWNLWLGPAPYRNYSKNRCFYQFRWIFDYSGGQMTDWGAHHNDIAQWGNGTELTGPIHIDGKGEFPKDGLWDTATKIHVEYKYRNGVTLICGEGHGCKFEGPDGWIHVDRGFLEAHPKELLKEELGPNDVHLYKSPGHHEDWLNCIETRQKPICDVEVGHRSVSTAHLGNISMRLGRPIRWDPDKEEIIGDEEASRFLSKPMRPPWHL